MIDTTNLSGLDHDGATAELADGRTLRVRIESDPDTEVSDYECYGRVAWVETDRDTGRDKPRPEGFDGRAEKLYASTGDRFWWQPPYDMGMPEENLSASRDIVIDLVSYGFHGVVLELLDGVDAYNRPIVREQASTWGVDDIGDGYVRVLVEDLVSELTT